MNNRDKPQNCTDDEILEVISEMVHNPTNWKYEPKKKAEDGKLPKFLGKEVSLEDGVLKFELMNMEYFLEDKELFIGDEEIELNSKGKPKNKDAKKLFDSLNTSGLKRAEFLKEFKQYIKDIHDLTVVSTTQLVYNMVENIETGARNNDLVQAVKNLLLEAELQDTYAGYVMPLKNNVCRPIMKKDIYKFIKNVTGVRAISKDTVEQALTYFNDEVEPTFNCIVTANGYYNFNEGKFYTESTEPIVIKKFSPYNYREELIGTTPPTKLNNFLYETFSDDLNKVNQLLEIFGYMLDDGNIYQILPHFAGKGRNGKGVCLKLLGALVNGNDSSVDVFSVDFNSKWSSALIESDINIINEVKSIKNIAEVKEYIGQDGLQLAPIYEQGRKYKDIELPKSILATNNFKNMGKDFDYALLKRLTVFIEFVNIVPPEKQNPFLVREIINEPDSMDWLLTNSIYLYQQIRNDGITGKFEADHTIPETNHHLNKYINPVLHTIRELYIYDYDKWVELCDYGNRDSNWNKFVSLNNVLNDVKTINPETTITLNRHTVKSLIMEAFDLMKYEASEPAKDCYHTERKYNQTKNKYKHLILGLLRK